MSTPIEEFIADWIDGQCRKFRAELEGRDMTTEPKYLVTKLDGTPVEDAVVIRRQDVFAPPALDAYANAIQTAIEVLRSPDVTYEGVFVGRLQEIADYFSDQAAKAWTEKRKLPD